LLLAFGRYLEAKLTDGERADPMDGRPPWKATRLLRLVSISVSASSALASTPVSFAIPLRYPGARSFDPSATAQAKVSLGLIALGVVLLAIGAIATVRMDRLRRGEPDYSSYGAFLGVALTLAALMAAVAVRGTFVQ
jgi:hypothetical protein